MRPPITYHRYNTIMVLYCIMSALVHPAFHPRTSLPPLVSSGPCSSSYFLNQAEFILILLLRVACIIGPFSVHGYCIFHTAAAALTASQLDCFRTLSSVRSQAASLSSSITREKKKASSGESRGVHVVVMTRCCHRSQLSSSYCPWLISPRLVPF